MHGKSFLILKTFSYLFLMELKLHYQKNLDLLNFDIVEFFLDILLVVQELSQTLLDFLIELLKLNIQLIFLTKALLNYYQS